MKIEKNTICYTSEVGHKNFWYPTEQKVIVKEDCEAQRMTWLSGGSSIAVRILKANLVPLDLVKNRTFAITPPIAGEFTIVWINRCSRN